MPSHRSLRVAEAIREVVSQAILFDVADPRVKAVTVLHAEVSGDLRNASVAVSIMGTEAEQKLAMRGLKHATGYLQSRVAARLQTKVTPALLFKLDDSVKRSIAISRLIDQAIASDSKGAPASSEEGGAGLPDDEDSDDAPEPAEEAGHRDDDET
jgi:ribosome-binding factor A